MTMKQNRKAHFWKIKYDIKTENISARFISCDLQSLTNLFQPSYQPLEGLGVFVLPPALHEALHLKLLKDHSQVRVRP